LLFGEGEVKGTDWLSKGHRSGIYHRINKGRSSKAKTIQSTAICVRLKAEGEQQGGGVR